MTMKKRVLKNFDLYTVRDAAIALKTSTGTVHFYAKAGLLKALRASNRQWLFTQTSLDEFRRAHAERKAALAKLNVSQMSRTAKA